jgi:hypothetical protein
VIGVNQGEFTDRDPPEGHGTLRAMRGCMNAINWNRALAPLALLSFFAVAQTGCAMDAQTDEETVDSDSDAISSNWSCNIKQLGTDRCQSVLADVRNQASAVGRAEIVERGIGWLADGNLYDRGGAFHDGYRRDCSGFVSMAWQFKDNPSTAFFPPFVSGKYAVSLASFDDMVPGDAVNKTFRNPYGHVMLFAGWASADHSQLYFMHHSKTGTPVALIQVARSGLGDFTPIRSVNAPDPTTDTAPPADQTPPADMTPPPADVPGAACGVLLPGQSLGVNQSMSSCDGRFTLIQQGDGNLVMYQNGVGALWSSLTSGTTANVTIMQGDGNLVTYTPEFKPLWSAQSDGNPGAWLELDNHGSMVIHSGDKLVWWSKTGGK